MDRISFLKIAALAALSDFGGKANAGALQSRKKSRVKKVDFCGARIFESGKTATARFCICDEKFSKEDEVGILVFKYDGGISTNAENFVFNTLPTLCKIKDGKTEIEFTPQLEGMYGFAFRFGKDKSSAKSSKNDAVIFAYLLDKDLYDTIPLKCDFHMHSTVSDGKNSPEEMGFSALKNGMDALAISDHRNRCGSEIVKSKFASLPLSITIIYGEEAHRMTKSFGRGGKEVNLLMPDSHTQCLFTNGDASDWVEKNAEEFKRITARIYATAPANLSERDKIQLAKTEALCEIVHEKLGGIVGLNHPYWARGRIYTNISESLLDALCARKQFDYYELANGRCGFYATDMAMQKHVELRESGVFIPVLGNSDAHSVEEVGEGFSVLFAKSASEEDLREAILTGKSVALDAKSRENPVSYGKKRLIKYAWFLLENYFPVHDAIRAKQAKLLSAASDISTLSGDYVARLSEIEASLKNFRREFFGREAQV